MVVFILHRLHLIIWHKPGQGCTWLKILSTQRLLYHSSLFCLWLQSKPKRRLTRISKHHWNNRLLLPQNSPPKELPDFDANCGASGRLICIFKKEIPLFPGVENIPLERSAFFPEYRQVADPWKQRKQLCFKLTQIWGTFPDHWSVISPPVPLSRDHNHHNLSTIGWTARLFNLVSVRVWQKLNGRLSDTSVWLQTH